MKKQIFAVCDLEAEYARNFMDYLNQKKNIPFEIQAFTNVSSFVAYAKENPVELLLISAEAMLDIGKIVILTEGSKPDELDRYADVYKYQASSDIVREVMACYGAEKAVLPAQMPVLKKTTELLGIYSPLGFCGQTGAGRHYRKNEQYDSEYGKYGFYTAGTVPRGHPGDKVAGLGAPFAGNRSAQFL